MINVFLPVVAGAFAYALVQFFWYAPFAFGRERLRLGGISEDQAIERVATDPKALSRFFWGVVTPAFLTSLALAMLKGVVDQLFGTNTSFLIFAGALGISVSLPKYIVWIFTGRSVDRLVTIHDGAMLCSLMATAFAIILSTAYSS